MKELFRAHARCGRAAAALGSASGGDTFASVRRGMGMMTAYGDQRSDVRVKAAIAYVRNLQDS